MGHTIKRLSLGVSLIAVASAILLLSDTPRAPARKSTGATKTAADAPPIPVAMMQMASQLILDEAAAGIIDALTEKGFTDGQNITLKRFNAEGDIATANAMAQELTGGQYQYIITLTTTSLQAVANANRQRHIPHIFGGVSDPTKAGVGVGTEPLDHPPYMAGVGTLQPVAQSLELGKQLNPKLKRIGVVWNPAEINSEISTVLARKACKELQIELIEVTVENTSGVKEAAASIADRVDALWVGGDVTVLAAMDVLVKVARDAHIPVCTCMPGNVTKGALYDLGANYYEVGRSTGRMAAKALSGESIAKMPVELTVPPKLLLNKVALVGLNGDWSISDALLAKADSFIDDKGLHEKSPIKTAPTPSKKIAPLSKTWQLRSLSYVNSPDAEEAERGLRDGLKKAQLVEGRDYVLKGSNAQGDMSGLNGMVDSALADHADLLLTVSTQALQSCVQRSKGTPIVFTMVANPFSAGVGTNDKDHLPNLTGCYGANDVAAMMPILHKLMPQAKKVGAIFAPAEVNAVFNHELLVHAAKEANFELLSLGINSSSDVLEVTQSLLADQIDLICLPNSNLAGSSFPTIIQATNRAKVPVFGFFGGSAPQGAVAVLARDYYDMGVESGLIAARVMRGEKTSDIPFQQAQISRLIVNRAAAKTCGVTLSPEFLKSADRVIEE
jgi:ABC-type uncharacterized transport system substrate-binding protein